MAFVDRIPTTAVRETATLAIVTQILVDRVRLENVDLCLPAIRPALVLNLVLAAPTLDIAVTRQTIVVLGTVMMGLVIQDLALVAVP